MANISMEKEGLIDGMPRDERGFWHPERGTGPPSPLFAWPPKPVEAFKYLFRFPGYLYPWNMIYFGIATCTWLYFQPALSRCVTFQLDWILEMFVRNLVLLVVIYSAWHYWLWSRKSQGRQYKYNAEWLETGNRKFLWGDQLRDNIFWCCVSAVPIWTAYEVLMMWAYANELLPYIDPRENPVYFIVLLVCMPMIRIFHFYWFHRLLHWPPLFKRIHYLHHKNINVGPWSGLAMHPIEHLIVFSSVLIHWIVPSHPIHMLMNTQHNALSPPQGHLGFQQLVLKGNLRIPGASSYFHHLHHRYFECNYGEPMMPLDHWFGTYHNGSPEAHEAILKKQAQKNMRYSA